jgi:hypothetical protein
MQLGSVIPARTPHVIHFWHCSDGSQWQDAKGAAKHEQWLKFRDWCCERLCAAYSEATLDKTLATEVAETIFAAWVVTKR